MKFVTISDLHFTPGNLKSEKLMEKLLNNPTINGHDVTVIFLGDVFDLCVGESEHYSKAFGPFIKKLKEWSSSGKSIFFIEGNHDFFCENIFSGVSRFEYCEKLCLLAIEGIKIGFTHGDRLVMSTSLYHRFIRSNFIRKIIRKTPFSIIWATSKLIRLFNSKNRYLWSEEERENFQRKFLSMCEQYKKEHQAEHLFVGHSHIRTLGENGIWNAGDTANEGTFFFGEIKEGVLFVNLFQL